MRAAVMAVAKKNNKNKNTKSGKVILVSDSDSGQENVSAKRNQGSKQKAKKAEDMDSDDFDPKETKKRLKRLKRKNE